LAPNCHAFVLHLLASSGTGNLPATDCWGEAAGPCRTVTPFAQCSQALNYCRTHATTGTASEIFSSHVLLPHVSATWLCGASRKARACAACRPGEGLEDHRGLRQWQPQFQRFYTSGDLLQSSGTGLPSSGGWTPVCPRVDQRNTCVHPRGQARETCASAPRGVSQRNVCTKPHACAKPHGQLPRVAG
jgi:hypothetical protein